MLFHVFVVVVTCASKLFALHVLDAVAAICCYDIIRSLQGRLKTRMPPTTTRTDNNKNNKNNKNKNENNNSNNNNNNLNNKNNNTNNNNNNNSKHNSNNNNARRPWGRRSRGKILKLSTTGVCVFVKW
ncbi:unnamed protein product [Polarella glacialis]|uniref:Uncharacterized protein n=1 Tax=Polarella glacialis TaxID=89957 RepID=A0A813JXH2_POLGL|nr:unnamed protein product [Polarella glacialis]